MEIPIATRWSCPRDGCPPGATIGWGEVTTVGPLTEMVEDFLAERDVAGRTKLRDGTSRVGRIVAVRDAGDDFGSHNRLSTLARNRLRNREFDHHHRGTTVRPEQPRYTGAPLGGVG